jgi:3-oxoacyl-[acyl-carrier protein] reductase
MQIDLSGKTALVTGAGAGIGRGIALALAENGAYVVVNYRSNAEGAREVLTTIQKAGGSGMIYEADVTKTEQVKALMQAIAEQRGSLDILVNNAGGLVERVKVADMSDETYDRVMDVNVRSAFLCCREALPLMRGRGWGRIINLASLAAHDGGGPGATIYATTKGALWSFTKGFAKEVAPEGITVNCVSPGLINTAFHDVFSTPQSRENMVNNTPLHREGETSDVAGPVLFLVSDLASFITGENVNINGGLRMC